MALEKTTATPFVRSGRTGRAKRLGSESAHSHVVLFERLFAALSPLGVVPNVSLHFFRGRGWLFQVFHPGSTLVGSESRRIKSRGLPSPAGRKTSCHGLDAGGTSLYAGVVSILEVFVQRLSVFRIVIGR